MVDVFLKLPAAEQADILQTMAERLGRSPQVLEKDVWVCWALEVLFSMPDRLQLAFKGGTSLSKVYSAIHRFSEDVDVTVDYRSLAPDLDPFASGISKTKQRKITDELRERLRRYTTGTIKPYFEKRIANEFAGASLNAEINETGEKLSIVYASALGASSRYLSDRVLLEFGGRNITDPQSLYEVLPDIAPHVPTLLFPRAQVDVLAGERTFWEKATLIHVECNRRDFRENADRLSRHWYDLSALASHAIGANAIPHLALLEDVVKHKKVFYPAGYANYDECLSGNMRLVPPEKMLEPLKLDYEKMIDAGMFYAAAPVFEELIQTLAELENKINQNS